jgi:ribosomal protein L11 methylase PrmA
MGVLKWRRLPQQISERLRAELDGEVAFMCRWRLTDDVQVTTMHHELPAGHATREEIIEPLARKALAEGGRVIDLGCHEGWYSQPALEWGADFALAVDVR